MAPLTCAHLCKGDWYREIMHFYVTDGGIGTRNDKLRGNPALSADVWSATTEKRQHSKLWCLPSISKYNEGFIFTKLVLFLIIQVLWPVTTESWRCQEYLNEAPKTGTCKSKSPKCYQEPGLPSKCSGSSKYLTRLLALNSELRGG